MPRHPAAAEQCFPGSRWPAGSRNAVQTWRPARRNASGRGYPLRRTGQCTIDGLWLSRRCMRSLARRRLPVCRPSRTRREATGRALPQRTRARHTPARTRSPAVHPAGGCTAGCRRCPQSSRLPDTPPGPGQYPRSGTGPIRPDTPPAGEAARQWRVLPTVERIVATGQGRLSRCASVCWLKWVRSTWSVSRDTCFPLFYSTGGIKRRTHCHIPVSNGDYAWRPCFFRRIGSTPCTNTA